MATLAQRSFSSGEISPSLYARCDTAAYVKALRTERNFFTMAQGGAASRPGFSFVGEVKDSSKVVRLIPYEFDESTRFVLEFGDQYVRFIQDGAYITEASKSITGVTQANPAVVTIAGHGYSNGDEVAIAGVSGMTQLNGRNFKIANKTANTFELQYLNGSTVNSTAFSAYTSGGTAARVYTVATSYAAADLAELDYSRDGSTLSIAHPNYAPADLNYANNATLGTGGGNSNPAFPGGAYSLSVSAGAAGTNTFRYQVTYVNPVTGEESTPINISLINKTISGVFQDPPDPSGIIPVSVHTTANHGYNTGDRVVISNTVCPQINAREFKITVTGLQSFTLDGEDGTSYTVGVGGGRAVLTSYRLASAADPSSSAPHVVSWVRTSSALSFKVYRELGGVFGLIGTSIDSSFSDTGTTPDVTQRPPILNTPFVDSNSYPSVVSHIQQRKLLAATRNRPGTTWASRIGSPSNNNIYSVTSSDNPASFTMAKQEKIQHIIELAKPVIMTTKGEYVNAGGFGPGEPELQQHSYNGSKKLKPVVIDGTALYVQNQGSQVRDLAFNFETDGFRGSDLTAFSSHLFQGYQIVDWAYQKTPHSIIWAVRDDGTLLSLTYLQEQQVFAWARHDTDGTFENVCVIREGDDDVLYVVVNRTIGGATKRYVERMNSRFVTEALRKDFIAMDSALSYDGRNSDAAHTMTLSGGTGWGSQETLTLTSNSAFFSAQDVGNEIHLTGSDGALVKFSINAFTSGTAVSGKADRLVPASLRGIATSAWVRAVDEVAGLWHLEGEAVSVFADGATVASPNNSAYSLKTVASGRVTLGACYGVIHVGIPFIADLETLDIDTAQSETLMDKKKLIGAITVYLANSLGGFYGAKPPEDDAVNPLQNLIPLKVQVPGTTTSSKDLQTGAKTINIQSGWSSTGRVFIRQVDPEPLTILAIAPAGFIPFRVGG